MRLSFTLTLRRFLLLVLLSLVVELAVLFWLILSFSERSLLESAEQSQSQVALAAARGVDAYLGRAPAAVSLFEKALAQGLVRTGDPASLRAALLGLLLADESLSEVSFTSGADRGFDARGNRLLAPGTAGEISVFRAKHGGDEIVCRRIWMEHGRFRAESTLTRIGRPGWQAHPDAFVPVDPTESLTFQTPADRVHSGEGAGDLLSTDLHWSQLDDALPEAERRVELSFMKAMFDGGSGSGGGAAFAGVLRVGLLEENIDQAVRTEGPQVEFAASPGAPPHVFLCDNLGHLVAAGFPGKKRIAENADGDLRLVVDPLPDEVRVALSQPALKSIALGNASHAAAPLCFDSRGRNYLCTFRALPGTQDWIVGVMAPRESYLGPMIGLRHRLIGVSLAVMAAILALGFLIQRSLGRTLGLITEETARMNAFRFEASSSAHRPFLADVREVLAGLERAKTAVRAMGKYVPVDLVRRLYRDGKEPVLGGEAADLTLLFTDIRDFTAFAEATPPDVLAPVLGRYLDAAGSAIQAEGGTVDKYIGDAVMAFWNAPEPVAGHPLRACRAALRCREALDRLYRAPGWADAGLPRFETRLGLHRCTASVGHFGAADRFNYTAIGDGVNLASRLEGLNKHYGTTIIASETVQAAAAAEGAFLFRLLDVVAVKGKAQGVAIYELLGEQGDAAAFTEVHRRYEEAFAAYRKRDFAGALRLLEGSEADGPSRFLATRCRRYQAAPPPPEWDGVEVFETK